jgi:integrase/recombinase XerD
MGSELEVAAPAVLSPGLAPSDSARLTQLTATWLGRRTVNTQRAYRRDLGHWITWCDRAGVGPLDARMMHMDAWIAWQRANGVSGRGPAAEASIARRVATISSWYSYLIRNTKDDARPLATTNPADTDGRPIIDPDNSPTVGLSTAEADRLITTADADGIRSSALIRLLLHCGPRCGSVIGADIEDLGYDRGYRILTVRMKGGKVRRIPLPASVAEAIAAMLEARGNPEAGPLFATRTGRRMDEPSIFRLVRRLAHKAGANAAAVISPHGLRHTFATEALDAGASLRDLQDAMGHADPRTTRRYDRARNNLDRHPAHILATRYGVRRDG